jgi:hypothetical protein
MPDDNVKIAEDAAATQKASEDPTTQAQQQGAGTRQDAPAEAATEQAAAEQQANNLSTIPAHADLVDGLRRSAVRYGPDFIGAIQAAAHEVSGLATRDAERLRQLLTQPKGADDAFARCQEIIDTMQGPDSARREVLIRLAAQYA